jgi:hypothetical protein
LFLCKNEKRRLKYIGKYTEMFMQPLSSIQKEAATYMDKKSHRSFLPLKNIVKSQSEAIKMKRMKREMEKKWKHRIKYIGKYT